jgi:diaminohydroxyphosphoribosylaminopyrimidine deaminase / 5-amino-6-(5-phosphoribosylamino)uracil reductase
MSIPFSIKRFEEDARWMLRALKLAERGAALAHPNPLVGAVVVRNGCAVGEGFHTYDGLKHAEVIALEKAGRAARGATLYVNLEPCCHVGRTPPCTDTILAAGIRRVVAAMRDPNPRVSGGGFRKLRRAGVAVTEGVLEAEGQRLNDAFAGWIRTGRPFVTMKIASTLDGQIGSPLGSSTWITSEESRAEVQQIRHAADALLTGIGTVLTDNPRMTDRSGLPRRRPLLRAVVDSRLRMPLRSHLVKSARSDLAIFTTLPEKSSRARALVRAGAEVVRVRARRGHVDLRAVLEELGRRQMTSVLIEAGAALNGAALEQRLVDKLIIFYAPNIVGEGNIPMAMLPAKSRTAACALHDLRLHRVGPDFVVEGYFRNVYGNHRTDWND